ncbi:MAG: hypothetical protein ACTSRZ_18900 [Promethearchaeota archaeon]
MVSLKKADWFLLIFLGILVILTILFAIFPEWGQYFSLSDWIDKEKAEYDLVTGLIITAFASFFGALVPFPVPYTVVVALVSLKYIQSGIGVWAVILLIIVATVTNLIGDMIDWIIGRGGTYFAEKSIEREKALLKEKEGKNNPEAIEISHNPEKALEENKNEKKVYKNKWERIIFTKPALIPILLILFGLTPLPDSLLFIPLGIIKYPASKTALWNGIGKLFMMFACAVAGIFVFDWFFSLLGGAGSEHGWISGMVILYLSWLLMALMLRSKEKEIEEEITASE